MRRNAHRSLSPALTLVGDDRRRRRRVGHERAGGGSSVRGSGAVKDTSGRPRTSGWTRARSRSAGLVDGVVAGAVLEREAARERLHVVRLRLAGACGSPVSSRDSKPVTCSRAGQRQQVAGLGRVQHVAAAIDRRSVAGRLDGDGADPVAVDVGGDGPCAQQHSQPAGGRYGASIASRTAAATRGSWHSGLTRAVARVELRQPAGRVGERVARR